MTQSSAKPSEPPRAHLRILVLALFVAASIALFAAGFWSGWLRPDTIQSLVSGAGPWAMLAFVAAVIVAQLLWMPRMWGLIAGGVLFGPLLGGALSIVADLSSAALCYAVARGAGRAWIEHKLASRPATLRLVALFAESRGGATVAVLRICPIAHYTLVSYAAGLAGVAPRAFVLGTLLGILPGAVLYPIVGDAALHPTSPVFLTSLAILVLFLVGTLAAGRRVLKNGP